MGSDALYIAGRDSRGFVPPRPWSIIGRQFCFVGSICWWCVGWSFVMFGGRGARVSVGPKRRDLFHVLVPIRHLMLKIYTHDWDILFFMKHMYSNRNAPISYTARSFLLYWCVSLIFGDGLREVTIRRITPTAYAGLPWQNFVMLFSSVGLKIKNYR